MIRWPQLLNSFISDNDLAVKQLPLWRAHPHDTALALLQGFNFIGASKATLTHFESRYEQFVNATPYDFSPRIQSSGRNSVEYSRELILRAINGENVEFNWLHLSQAGNELPTRVRLYPGTINQQSVVLAEFEALNRRSSARSDRTDGFDELPKEIMSTTLEESAEAVYITNGNDEIIAVNKAMCRICGYSPEQLVGKVPTFLDLHHGMRQSETDYYQALKTRGFWQGEIWKRRANGESFPAWLSSRRITSVDSAVFNVTIFSDISTKKQLEKQLTQRAMYDTLTGLPNRYHLKQILSNALLKTLDDPTALGALMFLDLNGFKNINDSFGHATGDRVLQLVAARLEASCIENADIARLGGDEFTLVLQDCRCIEEVQLAAEQVLSLFETPFEIEGQKFFLGTSIGITLFPTYANHTSLLISQADTAMYCAKKSRTHIVFYDKAMSKAAEEKLILINDLRHAYSLNQLTLAYQPMVRLDKGTLVGAEALLRWQKNPWQLIEAADFLPILEETGLIITIGQWVLEQACQQGAYWRSSLQADFQMSVNVSPLQLEHPDFVLQVQRALALAELPAAALTLEITESALLRQPELAIATLSKIKQLGVSIAIDDFGTGLSSLSRLGTLPIDSLKIDAEFAAHLNQVSGQKLCQAIIHLAKALDIQFVAEGIEHTSQRDLIMEMGRGFAQGFLFGKPCTALQFQQTYLQKAS